MNLILKLFRKPVIYICGNGGLAAESDHFAAELVGTYGKKDVYIPCISLCSNTALLTALANDLGFENIYSHQLKVFAKKGDILIILTTSKLSSENKHSANLFNAWSTGVDLGMKVTILDQDNLRGETVAEKQNYCIAYLHNLALKLKEQK